MGYTNFVYLFQTGKVHEENFDIFDQIPKRRLFGS